MVETRLGKKVMPSVKPDDLTAEMKSSHISHISTEAKEIFNLFIPFFSTMQMDHDTKIKDLDQKLTSVRRTNTALQQ